MGNVRGLEFGASFPSHKLLNTVGARPLALCPPPGDFNSLSEEGSRRHDAKLERGSGFRI